MCYVTAQINLFLSLLCIIELFVLIESIDRYHIIVHRYMLIFFSNDLHQRDYSSVICGFNLLFYFQFRDLLCCIGGIIGMNMFIVKIKKLISNMNRFLFIYTKRIVCTVSMKTI